VRSVSYSPGPNHFGHGRHSDSRLPEGLAARYISTRETSLTDASAKYGPFDLILEGSGYSPLVFEAMNMLAKNGVLAMVSVTEVGRKNLNRKAVTWLESTVV